MVVVDHSDAFVSLFPKHWLKPLTNSSFPMYLPVNLSNLGNMNWSIVVIGAIILLPGVYWATHARHVYIREELVLEGVPPSPIAASAEPKC
jgi:hypothetical protein